MRQRTQLTYALCLASTVLVALGCGAGGAGGPGGPGGTDGAPSAPGAPGAAGAPVPPDAAGAARIRISGAWALYPMVVRWAEEYRKLHPEVAVDVAAGGAGKGMTDVLNGLVDLGMVSREVREEEVRNGAASVAVVEDAVFPMISAQNPVAAALAARGLKRSQFVALYVTGAASTWGSLVATAEASAVRVYTRSDACGAAEVWAAYLGATQPDLKGTAVYGDPGLAQAVRSDALGLGFNNLGFAFDAATGLPLEGLVPVPIDKDENGRVDPAEDVSTRAKARAAIQSGAYPSPPARPLYLVAKGRFTGPSRDFVRWLLGDGQQHVESAGYVSLDQGALTRALATLDAPGN